MSEEETEQAEIVSPKSGRGFRRFLKFFCWCGIMALVILACLSIVAIFAYRNLTTVVNLALAEFAAPYQIEIGDIDIGNKGRIRIDELTVHLPENEATGEVVPAFFEAGSIELDYDFAELRNHRKFRAIRIENPVVRIDDAKLAATKKPGEPVKEVEIGTPVLGFLGPLTDSLSISGGKAEVTLDRMPPVSVDWELETGALDFASEKWLMAEPVDLKISSLHVGEKGEHLSIGESELGLKFSSDFKSIELETLKFTEPLIRITPETLRAFGSRSGDPPKETTPPSQVTESAEAVATASAFYFHLEALDIQRAQFELAEFESLPDVRFETSLRVEGLQYSNGELEIGNGELVTLALDNLKIHGGLASADHLAEARQLKVEFFAAELIENQRIENVLLDEPVIHWNNRTASRFAPQVSAALEKLLPKQPADSAPQDNAGSSKKAGAPFTIESLAIKKGEWEVHDLVTGDLPLPHVRFETDLILNGLKAGGPDGFAAAGSQELTIRNLTITNPKAESEEPALFKVDEISGQLDWESFADQKLIEKLKIAAPEFKLTNATLAPWLGILNSPGGSATPEDSNEKNPPPTEAATPPAAEELPPLWVVNDLAITEGDLLLDTGAFDGRIPKMDGGFEVVHRPSDDPAAHPYRATFERLRIRSHPKPVKDPDKQPEAEALGGLFPGDLEKETRKDSTNPENEVGLMRELRIEFTAEGIQRDKKIDRVLVDGGVLNIGDGLEQLVNGKATTEEPDPDEDEPEKLPAEPDAQAEPQPLAAAQAAAPADRAQAAEAGAPAASGEKEEGWRIGNLTVTRSRVQFEALIPQIAGLEFDIETSLTDIPLGGGGLLSEDHTQKVELTGIQIRDPYGGFQPVANLPTIFVEFTLAGLVGQRIDKIDLIGPELFVGEPLFQWVDYQRNFRKQNEGAGVGFEGAARPIDPPANGDTDWEIREIKASAGKIIIAPVGYPLGVVPFPFDATTNMADGKIDLKLDIPDEKHVYRFPDFKLDLHGLKGEVLFNVPIEQEENNLVQKFELKRAIWKQYEARDLWMFVSFDAEVIHGEFGGKAYDGYAEGAFNVYLKELGKWDAWIGGTDMDMGPITDVLAPENFRMDGVINCKLISQGNGLIFGETSGEIDAITPGRFNVTKLDDFLENLPESWSMMKRSGTQLGLETLKDFDYDEGRVDLYFVDRDGWFKLRLAGPTGTRVVNLYAHDWRKKNKKEKAKGNETTLDTAAADPSNETDTEGSIEE